MSKQIAIILTSIERDELLFKALRSILDNIQENWFIIVGYQSDTKTIEFSHPQVYIYPLPYNCGISYARNDMVGIAYAMGCEYILLTADSIMFNESIKDLNFLIQKMEEENYDLCGMKLQNRIGWEAKLNLISNQAFELDFIDSNQDNRLLIPCDIVRNFWIAKTKVLTNVGYDNNLIMCEHEDFFWRVKKLGFKVCCTNFINGLYVKVQNTPKYDTIRQQNFRIGQQRLKDKYSLKNWVSYINLERIKQ
jgi:GT2 family glycosyltransferase